MLERFARYVAGFTRSLGLGGAARFVVGYLLTKARGNRPGRFHTVPVGPYLFHFPLIEYFAWLSIEMFVEDTYLLTKTDRPLTIVDCGANIGVSLLYFKIQAPNARVRCFEPNPYALETLRKNIEANGWSDTVEVYPYALSAQKGNASFFVREGEETDSSGRLVAQGAQNKSFDVELRKLSSFIDGPIDLLKIDIEGAEFDVVEELIASGKMREVKSVQMEYHYEPPQTERPLSDMLTLLESSGFKTAVQNLTRIRKMVGTEAPRGYMVYAWRPEGAARD